ncbi:hypothetical protein IV203_007991 [Nitzschia inconspicua]|uniref:Uncharacterized protein n=1 Tax=Nitzschia inconspicua TaxID=303405 RepID=A0A9K3PLR0_9STRA|nr:hypothetical protein IV203_007991 [Nitzschia inconspicua]
MSQLTSILCNAPSGERHETNDTDASSTFSEYLTSQPDSEDSSNSASDMSKKRPSYLCRECNKEMKGHDCPLKFEVVYIKKKKVIEKKHEESQTWCSFLLQKKVGSLPLPVPLQKLILEFATLPHETCNDSVRFLKVPYPEVWPKPEAQNSATGSTKN